MERVADATITFYQPVCLYLKFGGGTIATILFI